MEVGRALSVLVVGLLMRGGERGFVFAFLNGGGPSCEAFSSELVMDRFLGCPPVLGARLARCIVWWYVRLGEETGYGEREVV